MGFIQTDLLVKTDKKCDYIPIISTISNSVNVIAKGIFTGMKQYTPQVYSKIKDNNYIKHLTQKSAAECFILCLPIINIFYSTIRDATPEQINRFEKILLSFLDTPEDRKTRKELKAMKTQQFPPAIFLV